MTLKESLGFEANEEKGMCLHEFRKVQPQKKNTETATDFCSTPIDMSAISP